MCMLSKMVKVTSLLKMHIADCQDGPSIVPLLVPQAYSPNSITAMMVANKYRCISRTSIELREFMSQYRTPARH